MEKERINVAEILKNCQSGMSLDCVCFENVVFDRVDDKNRIRCLVGSQRDEVSFNEYGCLNGSPSAKCVIFPQGETSWNNLSLKFSYKDGDILYCKGMYEWVFIYKYTNDSSLSRYVALSEDDKLYTNPDRPLVRTSRSTELRYATQSEKQKLFDIIKKEGYRWNEETKTLEELIVPRFKVGNVIQDKKDLYKVKITDVYVEDQMYGYESVITKGIGGIGFDKQDEWELVPNKFDITTLKPFDKVLMRDSDKDVWFAEIFSHIFKNRCYCGYEWYKQCIPYEGNEHLLGTANSCDEYFKTWE